MREEPTETDGKRRAHSAAEELTRERTRVRFDHSIDVPEDELYFYVFDAQSAGEAARAAKRAGLDSIRLPDAIPSGKEEQ
jgi:hypothetical protein